ncbi:MAG: prepilin peptidase [Opitutales bacterium]|nr:prepilin peptidase [Opitutales bacterium]
MGWIEIIEEIEVTLPWFMPTLVVLLGACVGSFLNVCIYRLPKEESILWPPSHSATGRRLSWWENIPVLSWIILGGKDRETKEPYGARYVVVEVLTAALFLVAWWVHTPQLALVSMLLIVIAIVGTFIDLDHMILPDTFTVGGMAVGLILSFLIPSLHLDLSEGSWISPPVASGVVSLIGILIGAGLVFWIGELGEIVFRKPAMGLGDVKLVGCIGAFCGWQGAVFSLFGGAIIGCILLIPYMIFQRIFQSSPESAESKNSDGGEDEEEEQVGFGIEIPFGPMLALGGLVYQLGVWPWVDSYFSMIKLMVFGE